MSEGSLKDRVNGGMLAKNAVLSLIGQAAPIVVALFSIPVLIQGLGTDRFGVLSIVWMIIGYFSLFDFGVGRALTQLVAKKLGDEDHTGLVPLVWTASILLFVFGLVGTALMELLAPWLVKDVLKLPTQLLIETKESIAYLAISIPIVISATALRGVLEAYQRFDLVNIVRIPMGVLTFLGPVAILPFSHRLQDVVLVLLVIRLLLWILNFYLCIKVMPNLLKEFKFDKTAVKPLITFGGWMTVSNVVAPLMNYMDRFIIGYLLTVSAVAYYTTSYDMVTKLFIIPMAILSVLFPAFSLYYKKNPEKVFNYYYKGLIWNFATLFPIILLIIFFAKPGLELWVGQEFALKSYRVLEILSIGVALNGLSNVSFAFITGIGRPDVAGKINFSELALYILMIWFLTQTYGMEGAAIAWTLRIFVDFVVMHIVSLRFLEGNKKKLHQLILWMAPSFISLVILILHINPILNIVLVLLNLVYFVYIFWFKLLEENEKNMIKRKIGRLLIARPMDQK